MEQRGTAVIADIVGSRVLDDRAAAQRALDDAILRVEADLPLARRALLPIVGDELQGVYVTPVDAMASLLLLRLALPDGVECRYGIGVGPLGEVPSRAGALAEGPAWWAARKAIETVHALQSRSIPGARTWIVMAAAGAGAGTVAGAGAVAGTGAGASGAIDEGGDPASARLANAYLLARDQLVSEMTGRTRRLVYGRLQGRTQTELARDEGITQSAVSQALATAGASAVVEGFRQLRTDG